MPKALIGIATYVVAIVMAVAVWAPQGSDQTYAQENGPQAVVEGLIAAFNEGLPTGDGAAIAALFAEDGYFTTIEADIDGVGSFGAFGRPAIETVFSGEEDPEFHVTVTEISADGGEVTGRYELVDSRSIEAGVERMVGDFTAVVEDGEIASFRVRDDQSDPQTAEVTAFLIAQGEDEGEGEEGEEEGPPGGFLIATMGGNQAGEAFFASDPEFTPEGVTFGGVDIASGPADALQPAGIHEGTCDDIGELVTLVAPLYNGGSFSFLSQDIEHLGEGGHVLAVGKSAEESNIIVSCGAIEPGEEGEDIGLPSTGSGGSDGSDLSWLIAALALAGVAFAGAGAVAARRR